ncbi:hypothetical protein AOQ84DRAFT_438082 [Glonium stellatum]|uniref:Uncharacterized protein n=1 Tax=Glonium stellatum TaxID=574774 RepID=A0A8E2F5L2_9PEZI|nr:hypothetical protein AOQ84DRAFT_438082 [Glonium stellatum]
MCGFIIFVGYIMAQNSKSAALGFLIFLTGDIGFLTRWLLIRLNHPLIDSSTLPAPSIAGKRHRWKRIFMWVNRILKSAHWIFLIITAAGAIVSACQEQYSNPGTPIRINLPSGPTRTISYNCTSPPHANHNSNTTVTPPTIWFESSAAHGVLDFLGLQHYLASTHNLTSCSYDPPNYGWSDPLPASQHDYVDYLPALLRALGQQDDSRIIAGWGEGLELAVRHAMQDTEKTVAVVDLDASPDGIEWFEAQRVNGWTEAQRLEYRKADIQSRIMLTEAILAVGLGFGLTPLAVPAPSHAYTPANLYSAYRAQFLRNPFWALQYYELQRMARQPRESAYLLNTTLPSRVQVFALLTRDVYPNDDAASAFYREQKLRVAESLAGGGLARLGWCEEEGCGLGFVVERAEWAAGVLAWMLEGL